VERARLPFNRADTGPFLIVTASSDKRRGCNLRPVEDYEERRILADLVASRVESAHEFGQMPTYSERQSLR